LYWLYLIVLFKSLKIKLIFNFECRRSELFLFIILQVSDNVIVRRSLLLPGYSGIGAFLDRLLQQRPKPTHLCVFQPRLPWRLQGYPKERLTLLRQLLEDTLAIRIIWHNSEKSVSERRVPSFFFLNKFSAKIKPLCFDDFWIANRRYSQLTLITRTYWLHTSLLRYSQHMCVAHTINHYVECQSLWNVHFVDRVLCISACITIFASKKYIMYYYF